MRRKSGWRTDMSVVLRKGEGGGGYQPHLGAHDDKTASSK